MNDEVSRIRPQAGYQMKALSSPADIVIGGGSAGAGKTVCLLLDPLRDIDNENFYGVTFRRTTPQITNPGALLDQSSNFYPGADGTLNKTALTWTFPSGSKLKFSHLEYEKNVFDWQGSELCFIGFDELTHFSQFSFFYLLTRNRSTSGIKPYVRATCNPDPDSWVAALIDWWIDENGDPIDERLGVLRYFVKDGDSFIWGNTVEECLEKAAYFIDPIAEKGNIDPKHFVKSITFIGGSVYENDELLKKDPGYLANLASQDEDTRNQLLHGNWKQSINKKDIYNYQDFLDSFSNDFVEEGDGRIVVDAAMGGIDKLMIGYFAGRVLRDLIMMDKSSGKDIIDAIKKFQNKYKVRASRVCYDANGVGAFIGGDANGFIPGAIAFFNNGKMINTTKSKVKYKNLKAQCFYLSGQQFKKGTYYIHKDVANMMYDDKMTIRQRLLYERKAIKKGKRNDEEPNCLIKKDEMKQKHLNGSSPDLMDMLMMNEYFYIVPKKTAPKSRLIGG